MNINKFSLENADVELKLCRFDPKLVAIFKRPSTPLQIVDIETLLYTPNNIIIVHFPNNLLQYPDIPNIALMKTKDTAYKSNIFLQSYHQITPP